MSRRHTLRVCVAMALISSSVIAYAMRSHRALNCGIVSEKSSPFSSSQSISSSTSFRLIAVHSDSSQRLSSGVRRGCSMMLNRASFSASCPLPAVCVLRFSVSNGWPQLPLPKTHSGNVHFFDVSSQRRHARRRLCCISHARRIDSPNRDLRHISCVQEMICRTGHDLSHRT